LKEIRVIRVSLASTLLGASFTTLAGLPGASAADLAPPPYIKAQPPAQPANDLSGFYAGVHAGYGWGQSPTTVTPDANEAIIVNVPGRGDVAPVPDTSRISGALGGGQIGYNVQYGSFVTGIETDISGTGWQSSGAASGPRSIFGQLTTAVSTKLDWFGTVRGRVGALVTPSLLFYGTGGLAYGNGNTSVVGSNLPSINCNGTSFYCASGA
jgi:outer membrane immunogenic protein